MSLGRFSKGKSSRQAASLKLGFETLEERLAMAVDLATITAPPIVVGKHTYVPLNGVDSNGLPVTYSVTSANASILGSIISTGRVLVLEVTGGTGASAFSGNLFIKLFEGKTPKTAARITELVNSGFYNNLTFHRISAGFVAQGGDPNGNGTGGSGTDFIDEFDPSLTFNSRGLFAMANAGDDDNDSQFFITDTNNSSSFPEHLNFNHTIFGIMVDPTFSGSDTFTRMMTTPVNQGTETPTSPITIKRAYLINDNQHAVLDLSTTLTAATTTAQQITIRATNSRGEVDTQTVNVTVRLDQSNGGNTNDRAFLNQIFDRQTAVNTPITFDVTGTDLDGNPLTFVVRNSDFSELTDSDDVTVTVTQLTNNSARITITPDTDFTGLVNLKIGVTDDTTNPQLTDFDTQAFNLFVTNDPISPRLLKLVSGTGVLPGDFVNFDTPTIEFIAPADKTVKVFVNGNEVGTATQLSTNNGDGTYRFTLPRNVLFLGSNAITAVTQENGSSSLASTPLSVTFAPSIQQIYVVPGAPGEQITLTFNFLANKAIFRNEVGLYVVDDLTGKVNGISPNSANYRSNVLNSSSRQTLFSLQAGGSTSTKTLTFAAGTKLAFYLVQNKSAASAVAATNIFFSLKDANADKLFHAEAFTDKTGRSVFGWEDARGGGDRDYNDLVFSIRRDAAKPAVGALAVDIAGSGTTVKTSFGLLPTLTSRFRPIAGEIGIFPVLDALGSVRSTTNPAQLLTPGSTNYVDTAIRQLGQQTLFAPGDKPGYTNRTINMAGGSLFGIYYIPRGTLEDVIAGNTSVKIFFSFAAANADGGKEHMRTYGRESENRFGATLTPLLNDPQRVHLMGVFNGGDRNFTDFILTYQQSL